MYANAQYINDQYTNEPMIIRVDIRGITSYVSLDPANTDYQNIMKLVEEGKLTIQPAEDINNQNS